MFNIAVPAHLVTNGWGFDATGLAEGDVETFALDFVAMVAAIHIGPLDVDAGQAGDLVDLARQGVAVIGSPRQSLGTNDELAAHPILQRAFGIPALWAVGVIFLHLVDGGKIIFVCCLGGA